MKKGPVFLAETRGSSLPSMSLVMSLKVKKASMHPNTGERTQLAATWPTFPQETTPTPPAIKPKPIIAPTMEWVVEIGIDFQVAKVTHIEAAMTAANAPNITLVGSPISFGSTMPLLIVPVTCAPKKTAPHIVNIPAMITACRIDIALAPTALAMEFATSFAPMLQAM